MSLDFQNAFNPRDARFLEFLQKAVVGESIKLDPKQMMQAMGMADHGNRPEPGVEVVTVKHACRLHCRLAENRMDTGKFTVVVPATTTLKVTTSTLLGIKNSVQRDQAGAIKKAFVDYTYANDGPLPTYVASVASKTGSLLTDYGLFLDNKCELESREYDDKAISRWIRDYFNAKERPIHFVIEGVDWLSDFPAPAQGPNHIRVPRKDAEQAVNDAYDKAVEQSDCGNVTKIPPIMIEKLRLPDEHKFPLEWGYVELECGGGFHFWKSVHYSRSADAVLYAVGSYPATLDGVKTKIVEIINQSAADAAFFALVNGDIGAGLTLFKALFVARIKEAFAEVQKCLSAEIYVVTETGEWKPA